MSYTDDERIRAKRRALYILAQRCLLYTSHTRIELERTAARSSFGISVHNAYLFTHLVYEDSDSIRCV